MHRLDPSLVQLVHFCIIGDAGLSEFDVGGGEDVRPVIACVTRQHSIPKGATSSRRQSTMPRVMKCISKRAEITLAPRVDGMETYSVRVGNG